MPLGAVTALFIIFFFKSPARKSVTKLSSREKLTRLDFIGTAIFIPAIVCLLLALQWGGSQYQWSNWRIIFLFVLFGILIIAFVIVQIWRQENSTVPPRVFKQRTILSGAWFSACLGAAFFTLVYYVPIWFQAIKGVSATKSGIQNLPMLLGLVIVSVVAGLAVTLCGYYTPFLLASTLFMAIGAGLLTTFTTTTNHSKWIGYQFIFGAGVGLGMQQPLIAVQTALPIDDVPVGTAIIMFALNIGGALFLSVGQNVFTNQLFKNVAAVVHDLSPAQVISVGATSLKDVIPAQDIGAVLVAYNRTLTQVFYVSVAMASISIVGSALVEWKSVKGKKIEHGAA